MSSPEMIEEFVADSRRSLQQLEADLLLAERNGADEELIGRAFRTVHSMKGNGGFLGFTTLVELAHEAETVMDMVRNGQLTLEGNLMDAILGSVDRLMAMLDEEGLGEGSSVEAEVAALRTASGEFDELASDDLDQVTPESDTFPQSDAVAVTGPGTVLHIKAETQAMRKAADCRKGLVKGLQEAGEIVGGDVEVQALEDANGVVEFRLRTDLPADMVADLYHIDPQNIVEVPDPDAVQEATEPNSDRLRPVDATEASRKASAEGGDPGALTRRSDTIKKPTPEAAPVPAPAPAPAASPGTASILRDSTPSGTGVATKDSKAANSPVETGRSSGGGGTTVRVSTRFLDDLLEFTGNMVMARNQLLSRYQFQDDISFATLSRCITNVHKSVVQQRMQSIGTLFDKFYRIVRDLARKLGKEVDLFIEGGDIELDRTILEAFSDPLTHMVRNALDHAIEPPEERTAAGKGRVGRLVLRAYHQSGEVIVEVEDDGRGIDASKIGEKAKARGLVSDKELARMQPRKVLDFIFAPGFSTKEAATDVSGRGVGMDVVRVNIERIGGVIEVHTNPGAGSLFAFRLPLTQAVVSSSLISALVVEVNGQRFAIPETAVNEIIRVDPQDMQDRIREMEGGHVYQLRDRVLSIIHLEDALGLERTWTDASGVVRPDRRQRIGDRRAAESPEMAAKMANRRSLLDRRHTKQTLVVIEFRRSYFAIMVDKVAGIEEVVVRESPKLVDMVHTFSGHTVLGDGSVVMMVDIHGIVDQMGLEFPDEDGQPLAVRGALKTAQQMIVFDNGPNEFFAAPLMMVSLIEKVRAEEIRTVGTREYYQFKDATIPILRLEDHLDVASNRDCKEYHLLLPARLAKPVGLLVGMDLSVEDFSESFDSKVDHGFGLIGTAFRDDRLVMLLDLYALFEKIMPELFQAVDHARKNEFKARVLMVEDNMFFSKLVASYLQQPNIDLTITYDGQQAWDLLVKDGERFDLIVSDIEMPNMNGFELVRNIKHNPDLRHMPVIALTSLADEDSRERGMKAGFDEYAVKIDKEDLLGMVFDYLNRVQQQTQMVGRQ